MNENKHGIGRYCIFALKIIGYVIPQRHIPSKPTDNSSAGRGLSFLVYCLHKHRDML